MNINEAFKSTFKVIFGECNLELEDLEDYLKKWHPVNTERLSSKSGKPVAVSSDKYPKNAKFASYSEIDFDKRFEPLNINEVKDIDSIVESIQDRVYYAGDKILGESKYIEKGDNIFDSYYVKDSCNISSSKYVAYSSYIRDNSEFAFGCTWFLRSRHMIRCLGADNLARSFETYISTNCSDLFFCYGCHASSNLMFSFNLRSKKYAIGNSELPKDKYLSLKKKLVEESREYIEKNKDFHSIFDWPKPSQELKKGVTIPEIKKRETDFNLINSSFKSVCKVIFGKEIGDLKEYENYLSEGQEPVTEADSFFGNKTYYSPFFFYGQIPKERMLNLEEAEEMSKKSVKIDENDNLESIMKKIEPIAFYRIDLDDGNNKNNIYTHIVYHASHSYKVADVTHAKYCACSTLALHSSYIFGSYWAIHSQFCIKCYNSVNLNRCFELSDCSNCTDSLFCHNSENLTNCMFCFNAKSLRYAIGNVELGKEKYLEIKKRVLEQICNELTKTKKLKLSIYNIGGYSG